MTVKIFRDHGDRFYHVEWLEEDGYTRNRPFDSYRAAWRYAMQVECRLQIEAFDYDDICSDESPKEALH